MAGRTVSKLNNTNNMLIIYVCSVSTKWATLVATDLGWDRAGAITEHTSTSTGK